MKLGCKNSKVDNLVIWIISILLILLFFGFNKDNLGSLLKKSDNNIVISKNFDINQEIDNYRKYYSVLSVNKINNNLTNILYIDSEDKMSSVIIDNKTGDHKDYLDMFKDNSLNLLNDKIHELLSLKYARFVVEGIENFPGDEIYEFKNNELIVYYKNYIFNPNYTEDVLLHVNYNEIDDYLNFKHRLDREYENENGFNLDPSKPTVAISFDDGPNGDKTTRILKTLEDNKMSATFFMVGYKMIKQSDIMRQVLGTHSEIGSHTYNHINMKRVSIDKVTEELRRNNEIYKEITGLDFKLVRPPYGAYTEDIIKNYQNSFVLWNVDTNDWRYKDVNYLIDHILTHADDGSIILMHDSYETSVETVEKVLPVLYSRGIQVVSVSRLAELKNISLEPGKAYNYLK